MERIRNGGLGENDVERMPVNAAAGSQHRLLDGLPYSLRGRQCRCATILASATCRDPGPQYAALMENGTLECGLVAMKTSIPGVIAVGEVRHNSIKRVASAAGESSISIFALRA